MTQANLGGSGSVPIGETISSGAIDGIAQALHIGFNALCECGLEPKPMQLVDDVYSATVNRIANVIANGNPAFDKKKFLIAVWANGGDATGSVRNILTHEERMQIEEELRAADERFGGDE